MDPLVIWNPAHGLHATRGHPERPARVDACMEALDSAETRVELREASAAGAEDLARVHDPAYLSRLESFCARGGGSLDPDTYCGPDSFAAASLAAGACVEGVGAALSGRRVFCLVRPPGHHATASRPMGFCLVNSAAVGARAALAGGARRAAVVDIDVHHGNGTQDIFWSDPAVLYTSMHQFPWYPGSGALEESGGEGAEGTTLNIPLPAETGADVYLDALDEIVVPALRAFGPDVIVVSAGFDAHPSDPLSLMNLTAAGYAAVMGRLCAAAAELCGGGLVAVLEGGYDLGAAGECFVAVLDVMGGAEPPARPDEAAPAEESVVALQAARDYHQESIKRLEASQA